MGGQETVCDRSRVSNNALNPLKEYDQNVGPKFMEYKKGKREKPLRLIFDWICASLL